MIYTFDDFELDLGRRELRLADKQISVQPQVFDLLAYLVQNHDRVVTRNELIEQIWPERYVSFSTLDSRVMAARKAIGDTGAEQRFIKTSHGRGFRFIVPVGSIHQHPKDERSSEGHSTGTCTTADGVRLAYSMNGSGPPIVKVANWLSHIEFDRDSPVWGHWIEALSNGHTLVRYDERGCGLSDWDPADFSFDAWVRDLEAVTDSLELQRFPLVGVSQGGGVAISYAVRHPERVSHLVLYGTYAKGWEQRNPSQQELSERQALLTLTEQGWNRDNPVYRQIFAHTFIPGASMEQTRWFTDLCRVSTSPQNAVRFLKEFGRIDVERLLPLVKVPTIVLHAHNDARAPFEWGREMAAAIPGSRFVPLDSANHILLRDEAAWQIFLDEVRRFIAS